MKRRRQAARFTYGNAKMTAEEREVARRYRKHYVATRSHTDAWNRTLLEMAPEMSEKRSRIAAAIQKVRVTASMRKRAGVGSITYKVHPLDVWGNAREGYNVNDVYPSQGTVQIPSDASSDEVIGALKREGFIKRGIRTSSVEVEGEVGYGLYIGYRGKPEYELRRADGSYGDRRRGRRSPVRRTRRATRRRR